MEILESNKEHPIIKASTISAEEFINKVYQDQSIPPDKRFEPFNDGGSFKYLDLSMIDQYNTRTKQIYSIIEVNNKIIGVSELEKSPYDKDIYWIKFVTIDKDEQGKGYASQLLEEVFKYAQENNIKLQSSVYSQQGLEKLKKRMNELAEKYNVKFIDTEEMI